MAAAEVWAQKPRVYRRGRGGAVLEVRPRRRLRWRPRAVTASIAAGVLGYLGLAAGAMWGFRDAWVLGALGLAAVVAGVAAGPGEADPEGE